MILFSTAETSSWLARRAPDFFSWISHRIECPEGPPLPALRRIRAALRTRARGIAWTGGDLEAAFHAALPGRSLVRRSAAVPYEQMVEAARPDGRSWVAWSEVDGPFRLRRVRWAMAEAGRRGRSVIIEPGVETPGFIRVSGRLTDAEVACAELEAAGAKHAGRLAALLDLDPELIQRAGALLGTGTEEANIVADVRTAADRESAMHQPAADRGCGPVETLLLDRKHDERRWVNAARAAIEEDDAEVAALWAKRGLLALGEDREALQVAGEALARSGAYAEAENLLQESINLAEAAGKVDHAYTATLIVLARALLGQARVKEAEKLLRKVVTIEKKSVGATHPDHATAIRELGVVLRERGRYEEAEKLLRKSAAIARQSEGKEHPNYAITIGDLGTVLLARGKRGPAEALLRESLKILSKTLGTQSSEYAAAAHGLGRCLLEQHKYLEAETNLRIAVAIRAKILGRDHPEYATSLHELARCLAGQGAYGEAEIELRRALSIYEAAIGAENTAYTASLHQLAGVLLHKGSYADAEQVFRSVLTIEQSVLGNEHPALCATLSDLGFALASQGQFVAGEEMVSRSIEIARKHGSRRPDIGFSLLTLARMQAERGGVEALETARQALDALQRAVGPKAPEYKEAAQLVLDLARASSTDPAWQHPRWSGPPGDRSRTR